MKQARFVSLARDTTIKFVYKEEKGKKWLDGIIKDLINIDLSDYKLINSELSGGDPTKKDMRVDFLLEKGIDVVIIEVQNSKYNSEKSYFYLCRVAGYNIRSGGQYQGNTTLITFNNFIPDNEKIRKENPIIVPLEFQNNEYNYKKEMIKSYEIILPNLKKIEYNKPSETEKKLYIFLCNTYEEMDKYVTDKDTKNIVDILERLGMDERFLTEYDHECWYRYALEQAKKDGIEEGINKGEKQEKIKIAKSMKEENIEIAVIMKITNLTKEEIEKL